MIKSISTLAIAVLLVACNGVNVPVTQPFCASDAESAVAAMVEAHGGADAWRALSSLYVEREHLFAGAGQPIRFNIHGEYPSHRIFQQWTAPAGTLAWDGERAWSRDWPLADRLMPRYVAGIGFYLVNMPWLAQLEANGLETKGCSGLLPGHGDRKFMVVLVNYEPDTVRKPAWFDGRRDSYDLYIDPESHRLSGVMQHWTYAGRLDSAGLPKTVQAISQLFVPESHVEVNGMVWPESYSAYTPEGELAANGQFFDYDFSRPLDEAVFVPGEGATPDLSSSYLRK